MARSISTPVLWSQYLAARFGAMALTTFDAESNLHAAKTLGRLLYRCDRRHRERTLTHLRQAFPRLDAASLNKLSQKSFEHLVQLAVEVCHVPRLINRDSWSRHIRIGPLRDAVDVLNSGKPVILVTGHLGNWEVLGYLMAVLGFEVDSIARPLNNRLINDWLLGIRQRRGQRVLTKWDASDRMVRVLERGGALAFIADQNAGDKGLFVPFFGRLASTYKSIGLLALTHNAPIICGYSGRVDGGFRYEVGIGDVIHPEDWAGHEDPLFYITARYMRAIEGMIRLRPEQYLWMHRRWKSRPRYERQGQPMPASVRNKLEGLPWMTPSHMDRLTEPA